MGGPYVVKMNARLIAYDKTKKYTTTQYM